MFKHWHWLQWNFDEIRVSSNEPPAAMHILDVLSRCDEVMPDFATAMIDRIASVGGRVKNMDDYETIRQWLAELLVIGHLVDWEWSTNVSFAYEPTSSSGGSRPEIIVSTSNFDVGIEVKCPDLRSHRRLRSTNPTQLLARFSAGLDLDTSDTTLPRDNPVKDFLISGEYKFKQFRNDPTFFSLLFVVWDDYINEPISALLSPGSGLFTENSFARMPDGTREQFPSTDGIVLLRHQHQFREGLANRPPIDERDHFLDYGSIGRFPHNALVLNPDGKTLPRQIIEATQAIEPSSYLGAEYQPLDLVMWIDT